MRGAKLPAIACLLIVYFHLAMAYAILGSSGVDVGKMDFLGGANWVDPI